MWPVSKSNSVQVSIKIKNKRGIRDEEPWTIPMGSTAKEMVQRRRKNGEGQSAPQKEESTYWHDRAKEETMNVYGIGTSTQVTVETEKKSMGIDDFLKIMTAQMKNLDPMGGSSADSSQYLAQMAQFTMLEQLNNVMDSLEGISTLTQQQISFSLVGKTVSVDDGLESVTGVVEKIRYREGIIYPVVNGKEYPMGMVKEVGGE